MNTACQEAAKNLKKNIDRPSTSGNDNNTEFLNRSSTSKGANNKDEFSKRPSTSKSAKNNKEFIKNLSTFKSANNKEEFINDHQFPKVLKTIFFNKSH